MKKVLIFLGIIVVLFAAIAFLNNAQENDAQDYYKNSVTPDELQDELKNDGTATVYFYSPECIHCQRTTPIVVPLAEDLNIDLQIYNVLQYEQGWDDYKIEGTPTIIHFENGKEVARIHGEKKKDEFQDWFEENVLK